MDRQRIEQLLLLCAILVTLSLLHSLYTEENEAVSPVLTISTLRAVKGAVYKEATLVKPTAMPTKMKVSVLESGSSSGSVHEKEAEEDMSVDATQIDMEAMTNDTGFVFNYSDTTNMVKYDVQDIKGTIGDLDEADVALASRLRGLNVAFIGDSLTRYQYIALCHFIEHKSWVADEWRPNPLLEKTHKTWHGFYNVTNKILAPHEQCDCFRPEKSDRDKWYENRYYYDPANNVSISYIQAMGVVVDVHGHFAPDDVHSQHGLVAISRNKVSKPKWVYSWANVIRKHIGLLSPKPNVLIINAGHWHNKFNLASYRKEVISAAKSIGVTLIWKTTTYTRRHIITNHNQMNDNSMCREADLCLNMSWTREVPSKDYVDRVHFKPHVYNEMNKKLLPFLFRLMGKGQAV